MKNPLQFGKSQDVVHVLVALLLLTKAIRARASVSVGSGLLTESAGVTSIMISHLLDPPVMSKSKDEANPNNKKRSPDEEETATSSSNDVTEVETTTDSASLSEPVTDTSNNSRPATRSINEPKAKCTQKDSAGLNKCLQQVLLDIRPRLAEGIPEINLPPMEPLKIDNVAFEQGSGAVKVVSSFKNVEVSGLSNFSQSDFWVDVEKKTMDFDMIFPQLVISGIYELSGNVLIIPIGGSGDFHLSLGGARAKGSSKLSVVQNGTAAQVAVTKTDVDLEIETIKVHLTNLFNGDAFMGMFINNFLNENSQEVFAEVKPQIEEQVGGMLSLLANQALSALSTSQFEDVPFTPDSAEQDEYIV